MSLLTKITGRVRGKFAGNYPENREDEQFIMNNRGDQAVAQALPERTELVRLGRSYFSRGMGVSAVNLLPTTAAHISLWNGEPDSGSSYVIDVVGAYSYGMNTVPQIYSHWGLAVQLNTTKIAMPTGSSTIYSLSGRSNYAGRGYLRSTNTITDNGAWHVVGVSQPACVPSATLIGFQAIEKEVVGRYIVPPAGMFSAAVLGNTCVGSAFIPWIIWHEVDLILG